MPPIIRRSAPHILISMFVAPIVLMVFAWIGKDFLGSHDVQVELPFIKQSIVDQNVKMDAMMIYISENRTDLRVSEANLQALVDDIKECEADIKACEERHTR